MSATSAREPGSAPGERAGAYVGSYLAAMPDALADPALGLPLKQRVDALSPDDNLVLLATALDLAPRPIRTAAVLDKAGVRASDGERFAPRDVAAVAERLAGEEVGLLERVRGAFAAPAEAAAALALAAFPRAPDAGRAIAAEVYRLAGYTAPEPPGPAQRGSYRYRDWDFSFDYDAFPHRTLLLLLADRPEAFRRELRALRNHHEWRTPARKEEALRLAVAPYRRFDYRLYRHVSPAFRNTALEYTVVGDGEWDVATAHEIAAALVDPAADRAGDSAYDEAVAGFGAGLTLHALAELDAPPATPRTRLVAAAATTDDGLVELAAAVEPLRDDTAGMGDVVAGLIGLREGGRDYARAHLDRVRRWRESPLEGVTQAFAAYLHVAAGNVDHGEALLRQTFAAAGGTRQPPLAWAVGLCVYAWAGLKPAPAAVEVVVGELEAAEEAARLLEAPALAGANLGAAELDADSPLAELAAAPPPLAYQPYVRGELANALAHVLPGDPRAPAWRRAAAEVAERYGLRYLLRLRPVPEPWEYALRIIDTVAESGRAAAAAEPAAQTRLLWVVDFDAATITAREQKRGKRGWSRGRKVEPVDLVERAGSGDFDADDERVIGAIRGVDGKPVMPGRRYGHDLRLAFARGLYHLDGHPRLVLDDAKRIPLEVQRASPVLTIAEAATTDGDAAGGAEPDLHLAFAPAGAAGGGYHYEKVTPTRYRVYELTAEQARLSRAIGRRTTIPAAQREQLARRVDGLRAQVRVVSATAADAGELEVVEGDTRPCAQLLPFGVAYKLELYARPVAGEELYLRIGEGQERAIAERLGDGLVLASGEQPPAGSPRRGASGGVPAAPDGTAGGQAPQANAAGQLPEALRPPEAPEALLLVRDLAGERRAAEEMITACPTLERLGHRDYEWTLDDDLVALQVLLELRALQQEGRISVEHPRGEKLRLIATASASDLRLEIRKERDWFEVSGKLTADEGRVVGFRRLLEHVRGGGGEFVELSEGEFVAITAELRARLEAMEGMLHERGGGTSALPTLAAPAFAGLADDLDDLEVDDAWRDNLARIAATADFDPAVPASLEATLRDYQLVGYRWLRRLAEWGVGGCLADDMGLGKTVQALALLAARAELGPALVIAPASVTRNWVAETVRFAPGITPKLLATSADARLLDTMAPGDLLVVSYGLLGFVEQPLQRAHFATIVLDEAQAIKNPATKRAKLIFSLVGDLRVATTGTPIENHLGELWSLFRFLNPGLLGSRRAFNEKYAGPIRRDGDERRAEQLRRLVRPFVLRRRKEEVLSELPPKTEVDLAVELSDGERALYEALRRQAVEEVESANVQQRRFQVLRQLTRLRQAACHPKLVRPESKLPSAKLELVGQTVRELLDNGHKALIFSQFVKHLRLVEAWVQTAGLRYCYLDGATPGGKREREVNRFQAGEADVFLISLKAGGTGLNLTAADFVLHLDPWWNPAAEDQASDRAHRIGQERPVTVYRFVSAGTIEEQILRLHAEKRDLADQILEGTNAGGRLSVEEVVGLLTAPPEPSESRGPMGSMDPADREDRVA